MTLDSSLTVIEEMSKPFEHIKHMETLINDETDWLAAHVDSYDSEDYKQHMGVMNHYLINLNNLKVINMKVKLKQYCMV